LLYSSIRSGGVSSSQENDIKRAIKTKRIEKKKHFRVNFTRISQNVNEKRKHYKNNENRKISPALF